MPERLMTAFKRKLDVCREGADRLLNPNRLIPCVADGMQLRGGMAGSPRNEMDAASKLSVLERKVDLVQVKQVEE